MPAAKGNLNAIKNGEQLTRLTLGTLPKTMRRQTSAACQYRRDLEAAVMEVKGEVNLGDAHLIDEAASAEIHASICRWLLRDRLEKMSVQDVTKCSEQILKAKTIRNRAFERLGLSQHQEKLIEALYADVTPDNDAEQGFVKPHRITPAAKEAGDATHITSNRTNATERKCRVHTKGGTTDEPE